MRYDCWFIIKGGHLIKSVIEIPVLTTLAHHLHHLARINSFLSACLSPGKTYTMIGMDSSTQSLGMPVPSPGCSSSSTSARRRLARASRYGCQLWKYTERTRACRTCFLMCPQEVCRTASRLVSTCVKTPFVAHRSVTSNLGIKCNLFIPDKAPTVLLVM